MKPPVKSRLPLLVTCLFCASCQTSRQPAHPARIHDRLLEETDASARDDLYEELRLSVEFANRLLIQGARRVTPFHHASGRALASIIYSSLITEASLLTAGDSVNRLDEGPRQDIRCQLQRRARGILSLYPITSSSDEEMNAIEKRSLLIVLSLLHRVIPEDVHSLVRERAELIDCDHSLPLDVILFHYGCPTAAERLSGIDPGLRAEYDAMFYGFNPESRR